MWFVIMDAVDRSAKWDTFCGEFCDRDSAIAEAKRIWDYLTPWEKISRVVYVSHAVGEDFWKHYNALNDFSVDIDFQLSIEMSYTDIRDLDDQNLVFLANSYDFDDDSLILEEIFNRADARLPGLKQRWQNAVCGDSDELPDDIMEEAVRVIMRGDGK